MRWKKPQDGDKKIKKKFLLFPKSSATETRWLESSICVFIYYGGWKFIQFLDLEKYEEICPSQHREYETCKRCNNTYKISWTKKVKG